MTTMFGSAIALQARREVRRLADDRLLLRRARADQIADHDQPGRDADAGLQATRAVLSPAHRLDQLQPRPHRPLGVVLMGLRIAEIDQHAVAHVFGHEAAEAAHGLGDAFLIGRNDLAQVLGVHAGGQRRRADQVGEHHRDLAALGSIVRLRFNQRRLRRHRNGTGKLRNRFQQLLAMAERRDANVLEIVVGQPAQHLAVDIVGAEHLGILVETDPSEPTVDVQVQSPRLLSAAVFEKGLSHWHPP